jgi:alpha-glucosidase (family GH31 glycosyl hydrolase)
LYLPSGTWYNYWTGKPIVGGRYWNVVTPLDSLPLFVKAGSIIPMQPVMNYVGAQPVNEMTLDIYPGPATEFELYEDDAKSLSYQQGEYATAKISCKPNNNGYIVVMSKAVGKFTSPTHGWLVKLHLNRTPVNITENNRPVQKVDTENALSTKAGWYYDVAKQVVYIKTSGDNQSNMVLNVD